MGNKSAQYEKVSREFDVVCSWYAEQQWRKITGIISENPKETYYVLWYLNEGTANACVKKLSTLSHKTFLKIRTISRFDTKDVHVRSFWEQAIEGLEDLNNLQIYEVHVNLK